MRLVQIPYLQHHGQVPICFRRIEMLALESGVQEIPWIIRRVSSKQGKYLLFCRLLDRLTLFMIGVSAASNHLACILFSSCTQFSLRHTPSSRSTRRPGCNLTRQPRYQHHLLSGRGQKSRVTICHLRRVLSVSLPDSTQTAELAL